MSKQQRLSPVVGIGLDRTKENHMVAAIISIGCAALKVCNAVRKNRRVAKARCPLNSGKFVPEDLANLLASSCCDAPRTLTAKWLASWNTLMP